MLSLSLYQTQRERERKRECVNPISSVAPRGFEFTGSAGRERLHYPHQSPELSAIINASPLSPAPTSPSLSSPIRRSTSHTLAHASLTLRATSGHAVGREGERIEMWRTRERGIGRGETKNDTASNQNQITIVII
jgi:hypothetical protein